jgi:hypothetical protein
MYIGGVIHNVVSRSNNVRIEMVVTIMGRVASIEKELKVVMDILDEIHSSSWRKRGKQPNARSPPGVLFPF